MLILGVDPGYGIVGYGVIERVGNRLEYVIHGTIETPKDAPLPERLLEIRRSFSKILETLKPDECAVEKIYFAKNVTTALEVAYARGVILVELAERGIPVHECPPQEVKISVTGYGRASKRQVQEMIARLLKLREIPKPDDAADALAVAWCAALRGKVIP